MRSGSRFTLHASRFPLHEENGMSILDEIVAHKRRELAAAQARTPVEAVREAAERAAPPRPFRRALLDGAVGDSPAVIAEVKLRSPVKGPFLPDGDPAELAATYAAAGAAAVSVLTDQVFFHGSLAHLAAARAAAPVPVLRKDFLIDPYDVYASRAAGADSILLIVSILKPRPLRTLLTTARALGMEPLVEVHTEDEMRRAVDTGAAIIGINNRDLHTFSMDLGTTERLAPLAPPGTVIVGLSGIQTGADARRMRTAGAKAVLVGEALVTASDPAARLRELRGVAPVRQEAER
jgi:indole-3-glycerol phosphate synthase